MDRMQTVDSFLALVRGGLAASELVFTSVKMDHEGDDDEIVIRFRGKKPQMLSGEWYKGAVPMQSGSATPVDPPVLSLPDIPVTSVKEITFDGCFDPDPPTPANPSCPECSGRGSIQLFTSTVPCKCCGGG